VFSLIMAAATIVSTFATLRLESIIPAVRSDATGLRLLQAMFMLTLAIGAGLGLLVAWQPDLLLRFIVLPPHAATVLWMLPISVAALGLYAGIRAWCVRKARFGAISKSQIVRAVFAAIVWLGFGFGSTGMLPSFILTAGQASADLTFSASLFSSLKRREWVFLLRPRLRRIWQSLRDNKSMIMTLVSSQTIAAVYGRLPLIVIAAVYGIEKAGYYALVERIVGAPLALISGAVGDVYRQRAADAHRHGRPFHTLMWSVLKTTLAISVLPCVALMLLTPAYLGTVLGASWQPAGFTMVVLLFGALVSFNTTAVDKAAVIKGSSGYIMLWHSLRLVVEVCAGLAAFNGMLSYETFIVVVVAARVCLYLWDVKVEFRLAKLA
jgi:O-antigen/teichoic acid export membrane protein